MILPSKRQSWWKPCRTRADDSMREHAWYLALTSDGSTYCWQCRSELGL